MLALDGLHSRLESGERDESSGVTHSISSDWFTWSNWAWYWSLAPKPTPFRPLTITSWIAGCAFQHIDSLAWPQLNSDRTLIIPCSYSKIYLWGTSTSRVIELEQLCILHLHINGKSVQDEGQEEDDGELSSEGYYSSKEALSLRKCVWSCINQNDGWLILIRRDFPLWCHRHMGLL